MRQANGVRLGVLGVIAAHPDGLHGYAVRQQWERLFGTLWRVGLAEVSRALGWLAESGWIAEHEIADAGRAEIAWLDSVCQKLTQRLGTAPI